MKDDINTPGSAFVADSFAAAARPVLAVDVEKYQAMLDGSNLTPEQKEEFLQALWSIMVSFVELGFGVHPLQEVCGQDAGTDGHMAKQAFDRVKSKPLIEP